MSINLIQTLVVQFECGTRILRVIHGRDTRATSPNCATTDSNVSFANLYFTKMDAAFFATGGNRDNRAGENRHRC